MNLRPLAILAFGILLAQEDRICVHAARGDVKRISLVEVRRAQESVKHKFAGAFEKVARLSLAAPYESGLPSCASSRVRAVRAEVPPQLVGKTIAFAPADRMPKADLLVVTSARRLSEIEADALADPAMAGRLGVRCAPTLVRVKSEVELELVENP